MKNLMRRSVALLLALFLCLSLLPMTQLHVHAAGVEYVYDSTGKYIYNWGTRGTTATFLSPNADAFYTGSNTYDALAALSGGTSKDDAPGSSLYAALRDLMVGAHSYQTSYEATKELYQYTDCQNSGGRISSFYSGKEIGPEWDGGGTWNREHTWPNSKGLGGNDENDIMMLRPTAKDENGARGNKSYGQSADYYHPNQESGYALDLRGDVARIFLYIYVRWGNVNGNGKTDSKGNAYTTWGTNGVIESPEVMLLWMQEDPVDTWELGRNDSVQSITGTRNVFVDYPELAFLLFGEDIPNSMTTPSGKAANAVSCQHNYVAGTVVEATCTTDGYTVYTCALCAKSYQGDKVAAGHKFVENICSACGEIEYGVVANPVPGTAYKFGMVQENVSATDVYYLKGGMSGYYMATSTDKDAALDVYLEQTTGGYYFYTYVSGVKTYINMVTNDTHVNGAYEAMASTVYTYDATNQTLIAQVNGAPYWFGTRNDKSYTTVGPCATSYNGFYCQFYGNLGQTGETPDPEPSCEHTNTKLVGAVEATCTTVGHTGNTVCADCDATVTVGQAIAALGHNYVGGVCANCGENEVVVPETVTATISFANKAQRTAFDNGKQVWQQNGITVTNLKAASNNNVADYANPARFYAGSSLNVAYPDMTEIEFTCNSSSYANALKSSIGTTATVSVSGSKVTVTFAEPQDSFNISKLTAQVRVNSITITAIPPCEHTNTKVEGAVDATCTTDGHTGKTVCTACGETIDAGNVITAPGHNYVDYICSVCGAVDPEAPKYDVYFLVPNGVDAVAPMVSDPLGITLPTANNVEGYTFLGWVANVVDNVTEKVDCLKTGETYRAQQDVILYALYSYEMQGEGGTVTTGTANISFANKAQRTEFTTSKQVWEQNGITVTNLKAASTNAVADYVNPARFYANSSLEIAYPGMTKIEFTCDASKYATALKNSIGNAATVSGSKVTVTFTEPQDSLNISKLTAQVRMKSFIVTYSVTVPAEPVTYYTTVIGESCAHSNTAIGQKDATCTEAGYKDALVCSECQVALGGGTVVEALGHEAGDAATCETAQTCIRCDHVFAEALGHKAGAEATCETAQTCTRCDHVLVEALGHEAGDAATCEAAQTCIRCDHVFAEALGHEKGAEATCETAQTCTRCDHVFVEALGHEKGAEATCETAQTCVRCDHVFAEALGHEAGAEATCETAQTCVRCDHVFAEALGHEAGAEATCETAQTCIRCDHVFAEALGHEKGAEATCETAQTCTRCDHVFVEALGHEKGAEATCETAQTCVRCDHVFVEALGHEAGDAATCETAQTCIRCDHVFAEALGHEAGAEATCTTAQTCTRCDEVLVKALGHKGGAAATCTTAQICTRCDEVLVKALGHKAGAKAGCKTAQTCTRCDYVFEDALGHEISKYAAKEPTCTNIGWKEYEACTRCSYNTYAEIAAKGHSYESVVTKPTCTEEGFTTNTCSVCGDTNKSDTVKALGHKLGHVEAKAATTEAEGNLEYWHCETCQGMWTDEACTKSTTLDAVTLLKLEAPTIDGVTTTGPDTDDNNDNTPAYLVGGVAVLVALAVLVLLGIKKFGKK